MAEVNYGKYKKLAAGETAKAKVVSVEAGKLGDFIPKENLKFAESIEERETRAASPAIQVKTDNGATKVIAMPKGETIHPKSALALWEKTYKDYPKVGQVVDTEVDDQGFQRIILKSR